MRSFLFLSALIGLMTGICGVAHAQQPDNASTQGQPVAEHGIYDRLEGAWDLLVRYPTGEGEEWIESPGHARYRWAFGGRYMLEEVQTDLFGFDSEWMCILGYDTNHKRYTSSCYDNASTAPTHAIGTWNDGTRTLNFEGEHFNPLIGESATFLWNIEFADNDSFRIQMLSDDGNEFVSTIEIDATRQK